MLFEGSAWENTSFFPPFMALFSSQISSLSSFVVDSRCSVPPFPFFYGSLLPTVALICLFASCFSFSFYDVVPFVGYLLQMEEPPQVNLFP